MSWQSFGQFSRTYLGGDCSLDVVGFLSPFVQSLKMVRLSLGGATIFCPICFKV